MPTTMRSIGELRTRERLAAYAAGQLRRQLLAPPAIDTDVR